MKLKVAVIRVLQFVMNWAYWLTLAVLGLFLIDSVAQLHC